MSILRPTRGLPGWASGVSGAIRITEPSATEKSIGWQAGVSGASGFAGGVPPSTYFNWAMALYYQWLKYFDDALIEGQSTVKSLVTSTGVTGAVTPIGTIRVEAESVARSFAGGITGGPGASHAPGTIYKDSLVSAWGFFNITGVSGIPAVSKAFNFKGITHPSLGIYQALFTVPGENNLYVALAGGWGDVSSPARTGVFHGNTIRVTNSTTTLVEVRTFDGYGDLQDPSTAFFVLVIGGI